MLAGIAFILGALFTLLVFVIAIFGFVVIFRRHVSFTLTKDGATAGNIFNRWADIKSYQVITESNKYYSNEMNSYQESKAHSIILTLGDGSSIRASADKLSKGPDEIIALFDAYKKLHMGI